MGILINEEILKEDIEQVDDNTFNTEHTAESIWCSEESEELCSSTDENLKNKVRDGLLLPQV